jgi:hypothetical protein
MHIDCVCTYYACASWRSMRTRRSRRRTMHERHRSQAYDRMYACVRRHTMRILRVRILRAYTPYARCAHGAPAGVRCMSAIGRRRTMDVCRMYAHRKCACRMYAHRKYACVLRHTTHIRWAPCVHAASVCLQQSYSVFILRAYTPCVYSVICSFISFICMERPWTCITCMHGASCVVRGHFQ